MTVFLCANLIEPNSNNNSSSKSGPLSPSVDLNLKIESCKKVWEAKEAKEAKEASRKPALMSLTTRRVEPVVAAAARGKEVPPLMAPTRHG